MKNALDNYKQICALSETDSEYHSLEQKLSELEEPIRNLLHRMADADRELLMEYLGTYSAMELRMVELACFHMCFPDG